MDNAAFTSLLKSAKNASYKLALLSSDDRTELVRSIGVCLIENKDAILTGNKLDLDKLAADHPLRDRLLLTDERLDNMARATSVVADLPDPVGKQLSQYEIIPADNETKQLLLQKVTVPLGLIGMIYESRPNVTLDAAILALKSGNAIVLRGGHDAFESSKAIVAAIHQALEQHGVDTAAVTLMPTERNLVPQLLTAEGIIDVIIPRGSNTLIQMVRREATVPVIETGAGVCHIYVASSADLNKAAQIVLNAKLQRPSVCNALDTIIVNQNVATEFLPKLFDGFREHSVEIQADESSHKILQDQGYEYLHEAQSEDFGREYLGYGCSIKTANGLDEALEHIRAFSSKHTEVIVSKDEQESERFLREVDAASVMSNASSRFTDGEMFGLGAEMGISTQKLHARGPFAIDKLVTEKWVTRGDGHVRG